MLQNHSPPTQFFPFHYSADRAIADRTNSTLASSSAEVKDFPSIVTETVQLAYFVLEEKNHPN